VNPKQVECTLCQGLGSIELTGTRCKTCGGSGWVPVRGVEKRRTEKETG
jgi:DnaJ-class molecular chaperone